MRRSGARSKKCPQAVAEGEPGVFLSVSAELVWRMEDILDLYAERV